MSEQTSYSLGLGWRILISLLLLALVAVLGMLLHSPKAASAAPAERPPAQSGAERLVLAFYYTWFDESTWTYDKLSDLPAEPYISRDRSAMGRHIDQAQRAGVDAFVVAWYGPTGADNQTEPNLTALLEEAAARGFKIAVLFETDSPFLGGVGAVSAALRHLLDVHSNHPAYLRVDGRPVIFFWRPSLYGVETWATIRNQVDPGRAAIWVGEGVDVSYLSVFDGHHLYSNTWNPPADLTATNRQFAGRVESMRTSVGADRFWVATVMPGYNDVKIRPGAGFARDREGGAYYERSWQAAIDSNPRWVVINSFNEWPEGSYIEPSVAFGDLFLGLTATWSSRFKAGVPVQQPTVQDQTSAATFVESVATVETPTVVVRTPVLNLRAGPDVSSTLLGRVVEGARLPIIGRSADSTWWRVKTSSGEAWVFGGLVEALGPLEDVAVFASATASPAGQSGPGGNTDAVSPTFTITVDGRPVLLRQVQATNP
ncbi:MAG: endo-1,3-alpha-glucanase family glycosylhydrolase [Caldilinea sp.]|nr:endo-1,3-alpha-glucanase family glycosylhydrolase [Caldilinea sp.]MDW8440858.1 endo-1,3-alpha-glucanase family glycosylhydrolase [Caldilineaceae bacterium]